MSTGGLGGTGGGGAGGGGQAGCSADVDCEGSLRGPVCDTGSGLCVPCTLAKDACPPGQTCTANNECAPGCTPEHACPDSAACCAGVCTDLQTDMSSCGACGIACDPPGGVGLCEGGLCELTACKPGFADCDVSPGDGCEVDTAADVANCGACESVCTAPNAVPACVAGACAIDHCTVPFGDCNAMAPDGCETNLSDSITSCGQCGDACFVANGAPACAAGTCVIASCNDGFADCDGAYATGCEASLKTVADCGACGALCDLENATESCASGTCTFVACSAGFASCDGDLSNGCEIAASSDPQNCGACGIACTGGTNATGACFGGACGLACNPGFANCDAAAGNGCECSGNLCCNGACEPPHVNGLGQPFDDCTPLGVPGDEATYTKALAEAARAAWPFAGADADCSCGAAQCVSRKTATSCARWVYSKGTAGHVAVNLVNNTCLCPSSGDPTWK